MSSASQGERTLAARRNIEQGPTESVTVELAVTGMTCAACAARVERKLNRLDGVSATVNFATGRASVAAPPDTGAETLIDEIERAGYGASPVPEFDPADVDGAADRAEVRDLWRRMLVAIVLFVPLCDLSILFTAVPSLRFPFWQWLLVALAVPVVVWAAAPFHRTAFRNALRGSSSMDTLVSIGIIAASLWSLYAMFFQTESTEGSALWRILRAEGAIYLEIAAGVTVFLLAGRYFEAKARRRAGGALRALAALGAKDVAVLGEDGTERRIPAAALAVGQTFVVRPGETIATDGTVLSGNCAVDRSTMTGESMPVEVATGETVTGGTVALGGRLLVRAERVGADTALARMVRLVEEAQSDKAGIQRLADRVCGVFVPVVLAISAVTLVAWLLAGGSVERAFTAALAVLVIACPCALGLATPTALLVASGRGAQLGIFIKGHNALESTRAIDTVVLDKTGTVTEGRMAVVDVHSEVDRATLLRLAGALEQASEHAIAAAITASARAELDELPPVDDFRGLPGRGARGRVDGHEVLAGRPKLFAERDFVVPTELDERRERWERAGRTAVLVGWDGRALGVLALADVVKPTAREAIAELHRLGLHTVLLTGDNEATARAVAAEVGARDVIAEVLPDEKVAVVRRLRSAGRTVAMVGDGVNDGPALAAADLGLAMVDGTDVAINAADLILVREELTVVPDSIKLARATLRTIRGNLAWAFGYNIAVIPVAALGMLNPLIAGATMALSSVFVVNNSLRLRRFAGTGR